MVEEEEDLFIKENPIVFKKYKVKKKLGEGAFGDVYVGQSIKNNEYVAIKVEQRKIVKPILESEAFLLYSISGLGIPEVKSFGKVKNYNILVEPLLGKSLFDIFAENHKKMPIEDVCLIGKQVIDRIQWVHSKFIVHRDIKPDNFLIGKKDPNVIYLIDFGLSKKYRSSATNKHIRFGFTGKLTGTVRFASANALRGGEQSRRDDIESIGYMLVYFLKQRLPWQGVTGQKKMERYLKIYKMKKNTTPEELCGDFPEMVEYISYAKKLEFEQEPDYNYLRKLFKKMLKRVNNTNDQLVFSWITDVTILKNPINPATRRDSPQQRIYKKIKSNLERERNLSSESDSKHGSYQQVMTQAIPHTSNLKVIDKNKNFTESEFEQKTDKKINKRALKAKEGLNTTIANLDVTVDENVDFENQKLKNGSKDTIEYIYNMSNSKNNSIYDSNKNIQNTLSEKKIDDLNKISKDVHRNLNSEFNANINNKDINEDLNKIKLSPDDNCNLFNIYPDDNINPNPMDNMESNKIIKKNSKEINAINNKINNDFSLKKELIQNINKPISDINDNILDKKKISADKKNELEIEKLMENKNKDFNNNNPATNNINIKDNNIDNENSNIKLKSSNFDGKEFTFNEPIDFKSNLSNNIKKYQQEINNDIEKNFDKKEISKVSEEKNIYALLTGDNNYIKSNENNNVKKPNNKKKILRIDNIENLEELQKYLKVTNLDTTHNKSNRINSASSKDRGNVTNIQNKNKQYNMQANPNSIPKNQINNTNAHIIKKNILIKRIKNHKNNMNSMNLKNKRSKENNNIDLKKTKNNEIKYNDNIDINKKLSNEINYNTFPKDNDFENILVANNNESIKNNQKYINSDNKDINKIMSKPTFNNEDFFNEYNNDLFDYDKNDKNENGFSEVGNVKKNITFNNMNNRTENNNKYRLSNYNYGNNKNVLNYEHINNIDMKKMNNKMKNKRMIVKNNLKKNSNNTYNSNNYKEDILKRNNEEMNINISNTGEYRSTANNPAKKFNSLEYLNNIFLNNNNEQNSKDKNQMNISYKNNYTNILESKDYLRIDNDVMINEKNLINNNDANNGRIVNLQTKARKSPGNQQKINKGNFEKIKQIQTNGNIQPIINNTINNSTNLNKINNKINNNLNINLINNNINNKQQIYYQIPGYMNNSNMNRNYNIQYLNNARNIQPQILNVNPNIRQQKFIVITPNKNQSFLPGSLVGSIPQTNPQQVRIVNNKAIPNSINPNGSLQYNMLGINNIYPYPQNKKYQASLVRK